MQLELHVFPFVILNNAIAFVFEYFFSVFWALIRVFYYTPRKLRLWEGILFSRPTDRVSVTFCFLNNFKNH